MSQNARVCQCVGVALPACRKCLFAPCASCVEKEKLGVHVHICVFINAYFYVCVCVRESVCV